MNRNRPLLPSLVALTLTLAPGCGDPLDRGQVIERTRPLAARVSVVEDETRAWPEPGEEARVEWLIASPGEPRPLRWAFIVCRTEQTRRGPSICVGEPVAESSGGPSTEAPSVSFIAPARDELGLSRGLALHGVLCESGAPQLGRDASAAGCDADRAQPIRVSADLFVQTDDERNSNPDLTDDAVSMDDEEVAAPDPLTAPPEDCRGVSPITVSVREKKRVLRVEIGGDDREALANPTPLGATREALILSHFSTAGELDRQFSVIEASDDADVSAIELDWRLPDEDEVPEAGRLVRLYFVARDGRGGADWTERHVCVVP